MNIEEQQYLDLLRELVEISEQEPLNSDRTGVGTWSVFGRELRFDLSKGFPLITTKRMGLKSILGELLWFISGSTNADELEQKYGCTIWREWKDEYHCNKYYYIYEYDLSNTETHGYAYEKRMTEEQALEYSNIIKNYLYGEFCK